MLDSSYLGTYSPEPGDAGSRGGGGHRDEKFKEAYPSFGRLKRKCRPLNVKKSAKGNLVHLSNLRLGLKLILVRGCENVAGRRGKQQQE